MTKQESPEEHLIRREVVKYFHREIHKRYRMEHLSGIPEIAKRRLLEGLTQEHIDNFEALFLSTVYPELELRETRDRSFESLVKMLKNPRKLAHIIPAIPSIMLRYATLFPYAMKVGLNSVLAFNHSMRMEDKMVENLARMAEESGRKINGTYKLDPEDYRKAYVMVPYEKARHMIGLSNSVMKAGRNMTIMDAAWNIMDEVQASLIHKDKSRTAAGLETEHGQDIDAIEYGKAALENIRSTFKQYDSDTMRRMIEISHINELDYNDIMYGKTRPA